MAKSTTHNGAVCHDHSQNHALEFFSKAGSQFVKQKSHYGQEASALDLFKNVWFAGDHNLAMRLLFWLRDPRGGAGNRSGFRDCVKWVSETEPKWVIANAHLIPEFGRWDDMRSTFGTKAEDAIVDLWAKKISEKDFLASKWAKRTDKQILSKLRANGSVTDIGEFRRLLSTTRKAIPEALMCSDEWNGLDYSKIPSVAMSRYTKAFQKHDAERFASYKNALVKGTEGVKVNASVLFPHDIIRTVRNGDEAIANAQFKALPNYMGDTKLRALTIVDTSGSMRAIVSGSIERIDISVGLGLYCSDRLGKDNPFYRKFLQFSGESKLTDWSGYENVSDILKSKEFNGIASNTNVELALDTILNYAKMFNATDEQIPNCLLIVSDMQFDGGGVRDMTVVDASIAKWVAAGYSRPKIVYWNVAGYAGSPDTISSKDVALVSGFSPSILSSVFSGEDLTPYGVLVKALDKYKIVTPE